MMSHRAARIAWRIADLFCWGALLLIMGFELWAAIMEPIR